MSIAAMIRSMAAAGASAEAIAIAVEAIEARDSAAAATRAKAAERKARQRERERDSHATVTGQSKDSHGTVATAPAPERPSELNSKPTEFNQNPTPLKPPRPDGEEMLIAAGVEPATIAEWKQTRKAKRAGPITPLVAKGQLREAVAAGWTPEAATLICIERGWQAFRAEYVAERRQTGPPRPAPKHDARHDLNAWIAAQEAADEQDRERQADRPPLRLLASSGH